VYTVDTISPILTNQHIAVSHGITGITGTALVLIGYCDLIKNDQNRKNKNRLMKAITDTFI